MNKNVESILESASIKMMERYNELVSQGKDIIGLTIGEPDYNTPACVVKKAIDELRNGNTHYSVGKGILKLRQKICEKLQMENSATYNVNQIIVTPGAKMAIYLSIASCINDRDEVMLLTPCWVSYFEIVKSVGGIPVEVPLSPLNNYLISEELLNNYYTSKTKILIVNNPNNPTGRVLSRNEIVEIERFARDKNIIIISDEIYEKLIYDNRTFISLASVDSLYDKVITINGFSKAFAMTGWRIGYLAAPTKYIDIINKLYSHTCTGTPPFIQEAAYVALANSSCVEIMRTEFERRRDFFVSGLKNKSNIEMCVPEGAFYVWLRIKDLDKAISSCEYLLNECGVLGVPGDAYGSGFKNYVRLSFAVDILVLEKALKRINTK